MCLAQSRKTAKLRNPVDLQHNVTALVGFLEKQAKQKLNLNIEGDMQCWLVGSSVNLLVACMQNIMQNSFWQNLTFNIPEMLIKLLLKLN